jgi:hypothetical protein
MRVPDSVKGRVDVLRDLVPVGPVDAFLLALPTRVFEQLIGLFQLLILHMMHTMHTMQRW